MRWFRRTASVPHPHASILDRERLQLEQLIETTPNRAIAEMARIKLRVVKFVSGTVADGSPTADTTESALDSVPISLELPRTMSVAPVAHLLDLSKQDAGLMKIRAFAPIVEPARRNPAPAQPSHAFDAYFQALCFHAGPTPKPSISWALRRWLGLACLYGFVLLSLFLMCYSATHPNASKYSLWFSALSIGSSIALLAGFFASLLRECEMPDSISQNGVTYRCTLHIWKEISQLMIDYRDGYAHCRVTTDFGKRFDLRLDVFNCDPAQWRRRLQETARLFDFDMLETGDAPPDVEIDFAAPMRDFSLHKSKTFT